MPVRIDVISDIHGAEHCEWESAEFITTGRPLGRSIDCRPITDEIATTYVWDPERVLPDGPVPDTVAIGDLASTVANTGYRRQGAELWIDSADESRPYVVPDGRADV